MRDLSSLELAVADHLWQSTIFAVAVWLMTLVMQRKRAEVRHGLWLAASVKFLIPFSLLVWIGGPFSVLQHAATDQPPAFYEAVSSVTQPFSEIATAPVASHAHETRAKERLIAWWPATAAVVWFAGMAAVLVVWYLRLRQIAALVGRSEPLEEGREVELLRSLARQLRARWRVRLVRLRTAMEPGIFGIFRPVLIWPEGLSELLDDEHLEAVLAHETMHVRRHDNLTAALQMAVEAVFWFHPLVWWMGRRMVEERERACDEAVVRLGNGPAIYAEGLLTACRFSVESSLACVAGVTGADLNKRIRAIMKPRIEELSVAGKLALALLGSIAVTGPVAYGIVYRVPVYGQLLIASAPRPSFAVAAIEAARPDEEGCLFDMDSATFTVRHCSLMNLIKYAYNMRPRDPSIGGPSWLNTKFFDIQAKREEKDVETTKHLSSMQQFRQNELMLQSLLEDRFHLRVNTTTKEREVYALVIDKNGVKLKEVKPAALMTPGESGADYDMPPPPPPPPPPGGASASPMGNAICIGLCFTGSHQLTGNAAPMGMLLAWLVRYPEVDRLIVDETGLRGKYDFVLNGVAAGPAPTPDAGGPTSEDASPSIFTLLREQLGLRLKPKKAPVQVLVIDHAEMPSAN